MIVNLIRFVRVEYKGEGTLRLSTDLPGPNMAALPDITLPANSQKQERRFQIAGNTKAHRIMARFIAGAGTLQVENVFIYAKALGVGATAWRWVPLPIPRTPEEWTRIQLPIPPTPEDWTRIQLPIPPTPEDWQRIQIVNPQDTDWRWVEVPGREGNNP